MNELQQLPPPGDAPYPPSDSLRAGYEIRDLDVPGVALALIGLAVLGVILIVVLWGYFRNLVPPAATATVSPPVQMPGEASVNDRLRAIPPPRLDALVELKTRPPSYRTSNPARPNESNAVQSQDMRADRQPRLQSFGWVDRKKGIAHVPIDLAMQAMVEMNRAKAEHPAK